MPNDLPAPDGEQDFDPTNQNEEEHEDREEEDGDAFDASEFEGAVGVEDAPVATFEEDEAEDDIDTSSIRNAGSNVRDDIDRETVDKVARSVARVGRRLKYRVERLEPSDLPVNELAVSDWFALSSTKPTGDDLQEDLRKRYGGGRYHVEIRPIDSNDETDTKEVITIELGGEPRLQTTEGRMFYMQRHGYLPGGSENSSVHPDPNMGGGMGMLMSMITSQQKQMEERMEREREEQREARRQETSVLAELVRAQSNKGGGTAELIAAFGAVAGAFVPVLTEALRGRRESEERRQEREDRKFEEMLKRFEEKGKDERGPGDMMQMLSAYTKIIEEGARGQMQVQSKAMEQMMSQAIKRMSDSGDTEGAGLLSAFTDMIRENGGDLLRQGMALFARGQQSPAPPGMDPRLLAMQQAQQAQAQQAQAQQALQPGQTQQAQAHEPGAQSSGQPEQRDPTPEEQAQMIGMQSMAHFIITLRTLIHQQPDADTAWVTNYNGQPMETLFGNSNKVFRKRVIESAEAGVVHVASWIEGVNEPQLLAAAGEIDTVLEKDDEAKEWFADFLAKGPWVEDDDDSEEDESDAD